MKTTYIYELSKNGIPFYVGKTVNPTSRTKSHREKYGNDITLIVIDEIVGDKTQWIPVESYWIEQYKQWGYILENKNNGGQGKVPIYSEEESKQIRREWNKLSYQKFKTQRLETNKNNYTQNREKHIQDSIKLHQIRKCDPEWRQQKREYDKQYYQRKRGNGIE